MSPDFSGSLPNARPNAASTFLAWSRSKRSTAAVFWPCTRSISSSRMNRVTAIQKSSRTMTTHCTRPPSHCRRACTSSVFSSSFLACSHCSNWSRTISTFLPDRNALPSAQCRQRLFQTKVGRQGRTAFPQAVQQASLRLVGGGLDVNGDHLVGQPRQQARLDQRRLAAAR